ncbi:MAG: hypothetical protein KDB53_11720, partial [Planctomycetes bacterium]|nr:hypothetical protein [Planctomycetota bacterium]
MNRSAMAPRLGLLLVPMMVGTVGAQDGEIRPVGLDSIRCRRTESKLTWRFWWAHDEDGLTMARSLHRR